MPWGETIEVQMGIGFPTDFFTLDDATLGRLNIGGFLDGTTIVDVSAFVKEISIRRGRTDQLARINAGTATIDFVNNDRRFDPINTASPYYDVLAERSGVQPRRFISIKMNGITVFTGLITDVDIEYEQQDQSVATFEATDAFGELANNTFSTTYVVSEQASGARVNAVLNLADVVFTGGRQIDAGSATLAAAVIDPQSNVLDYLQQVAQSERGFLFIKGDGTLRFTDRERGIMLADIGGTVFVADLALFFDSDAAIAFSSEPITFTDDGVGIGYTTLGISYGQEFLFNKIVGNRTGGPEITANDVGSQAEYGISTLSIPELLLNDDDAVARLLVDLLQRFAEPKFRFDRITVVINSLTNLQRNEVVGLELNDPILVKRTFGTGTPASVSLGFGVQQINHRVTPTGHTVEFGIEVRPVVFPLTLDDATLGRLDKDNALA